MQIICRPAIAKLRPGSARLHVIERMGGASLLTTSYQIVYHPMKPHLGISSRGCSDDKYIPAESSLI
jgi:hypothetical protein